MQEKKKLMNVLVFKPGAARHIAGTLIFEAEKNDWSIDRQKPCLKVKSDESAQRKCTCFGQLHIKWFDFFLVHAMFKTHSLRDYIASLQYLYYIQFLITK